MPSSNYLRGKVIDATLRNTGYTTPVTVYVSLHTSDPTVNATAATEATGSWYGRVVGTFSAQSTPGQTSNSAIITYNAVTTSTIVISHFAIWDASTLGNMLYFAALSAPKTFNPTDVPSWLAGSLIVTAA